MKDSGIEWIGTIPDTWEVQRFKNVMHKDKKICEHYQGQDIISLTMNGVIKRDLENPSGKMPTTWDGYQFVEPEDLLLCLFDIDVTPRCVGLVKDAGLTSPAYSRFKVHKGYYNAYYDYLLRWIDDEKIFIHLSKNLRSSLSEDDFGAIHTIVPPLPEQQKIAAFLDKQCSEIDAVLTKTKESIEEYKLLKNAIITQAVTKGIRPNRKMKDSGIEWIGEIPEEWEVRKIKHEGTARNGLTYAPTDVCDEKEGTLVLRSSNIQDNKLILDDCVFVNTEIKKELFVKENDILICSRNGSAKLIGKNALLPPKLNATFGAFMLIYRCKNPLYIRYVLSSDIFSYYLGNFLTVSVNQLTIGNFNEIQFPLPQKHEQSEIVEYLDKKCSQIDTLITKKEQLITELETYKKSLIYEYVTGKKEVQ